MTKTPDQSETLIKAAAEELRVIEARGHRLDVAFEPGTVLNIVGMLQLALRHPGASSLISPTSAQAARAFIDAARQFFTPYPALTWIVEAGDKPEHDVASLRTDPTDATEATPPAVAIRPHRRTH